MKDAKLKKRVFIIHGWDGYPEEGWFPWLKKELKKRGFDVQVPAMPNTSEPKIGEWVPYLSKLVGEVDEDTFFVGHSIGCQTILRYLERLPENKKIGGVVLVAGWFTLTNLSSEEEWKIAKPWIETPISIGKIRKHTNNFVVVLSDNDDWVPLGETRYLFETRLGAKTITEHDKGHFDNIRELPSALEALLSF